MHSRDLPQNDLEAFIMCLYRLTFAVLALVIDDRGVWLLDWLV